MYRAPVQAYAIDLRDTLAPQQSQCFVYNVLIEGTRRIETNGTTEVPLPDVHTLVRIAVVYADGTPVRGPKALCELQGYTYDAWVRMADAFQYFGQLEAATRLRKKAADLRERFEERFWSEGTGFYVYALDGNKRQVQTIASNAGHLLWSGIPSPERAARVVARLLS